jgi:hypothetical protein
VEFLAESYLEAADQGPERRLAAVTALTAVPGASVSHLRTIVIPEDETLLLLFEAPSVEAVRETLALAGITCDRITRASTREGFDG